MIGAGCNSLAPPPMIYGAFSPLVYYHAWQITRDRSKEIKP